MRDRKQQKQDTMRVHEKKSCLKKRERERERERERRGKEHLLRSSVELVGVKGQIKAKVISKSSENERETETKNKCGREF